MLKLLIPKDIRNEFKKFNQKATILFWSLILLVGFECFATLIAPFIISNTIYLSWYLDDKAIESTKKFFSGDSLLEPDEILGWRSRPNTQRNNWEIDEHGSRTHHPFTLTPSKPIRVLFLGSSMINGGMTSTKYETISAYLEDDLVEALNFGTMLYSIDQSLLSFQKKLYKYSPNIIVVGLDSDPISGLKNIYIPFRTRDEVYMPFLKPRFILKENTLHLVKPKLELLKSVPHDTQLLKFLSKHDEFYNTFKFYKHSSLSPIATTLRNKLQGINKLIAPAQEDQAGFALLLSLMNSFTKTATEHNAQIIFLSMPDKNTLSPGKIRKQLTNSYWKRVKTLGNLGFNILETGNILRASKIPIRELYRKDNIHFTPVANKLVAENLRLRVKALSH